MRGEVLTPGAGVKVDIQCDPPKSGSSTVVWLRVVNNNVEFIGSFQGGIERKLPDTKVYSSSRMSPDRTLRLKSFDAARDSGLYVCASVVGSNLIFGKVTRLIGTAPVKPAPTTKPDGLPITPTVCTCDIKAEEAMAPLVCAPLVLWAFVGGCGLLLLALLSTIVYCTRIRTRRCPHHYKRQKPQKKVEGKQAIGNNLIAK